MRHKRVIYPILTGFLIILIGFLIFRYHNMSKNSYSIKDYTENDEITLNKSDFISGLWSELNQSDDDTTIIKIVDSNNYLSSNFLYKIDNASFRINIDDTNLRIIINEYTDDNILINSTDLGDHDIFTTNTDTEKISISIYEYQDGKVSPNSYDSLKTIWNNSICLNKISDLDSIQNNTPTLSTYISKGSLSNYSNYRIGSYKSWGGEYTFDSGSYCIRDLYKIDQNSTYYININDYRVRLAINEYDENGNWIGFCDTFTNNSTYTPVNEKAAYISITIRSSDWESDCLDLLKEGLIIDFSDEFYINNLDVCEYDDFDFTRSSNYASGIFYQNGIGVNSSCIRSNSYIKISNTDYMINLYNHYFNMVILEFDENGQYLGETTFTNGETFTPNQSTCYVGFYIKSEEDLSLSYFKHELSNNVITNFSPVTKYEHNTVMNSISATDFVNYMNVGWNLGNSLDSHYGERTDQVKLNQETYWGNPVISKDLIDYVADSGFNTIRIPVTWYYNTYTDSDGNLKIYDSWLERVAQVVDYCIEDGLYVILNTHHEQPIIYAGATDAEMETVYKNASDLWSCIANYFADYDEHLIFESYNEIDNVALSWNFSEAAANQVNTLNQIFVDTVRNSGGNNSERLLMIPTLLDGCDSSYFESFTIPTDSANNKLILTVHNYSTVYTSELLDTFSQLSNYANNLGLPLIIGEFGTKESSFNPKDYRDIHASNYVACAAYYGIKCIYWDNGNLDDYGIIDRMDLENSRTDIIDSLINPTIYEFRDSLTLTSINDFLWMSLNQTSGELQEDKYWGTIVTGNLDSGITLDSSYDYISLSLYSISDFETLKIHYVHFYDENMNLIEANNSSYGYKNETFKIPDGAKYVRIGINNSYKATKEIEYSSGLDNGLIKLSIGFVDIDSSDSIKSQ